MFGMGMMDMGMGMGMMDMGMMDMGMGMGMMGAGMMGVGAMDMGMGLGMGMVGAQMMGMGALGMGMGMRRGLGYCAPGCIDSCCRTVIVCPSNCNQACCTSRRIVTNRCPPGCVRTCCINNYNDQLGFMRTTPQLRNPQMYSNPNQNFINLPPQRNNVNPIINQGINNPNILNQTPNPNITDIQQQKLIQQQIRIQNQKKKQIIQKQALEKEELMINQQNLMLQQKKIQQLKTVKQQQNLQISNQNIQGQNYNNNNGTSNEQIQPAKRILFESDIYVKISGRWQLIKCAQLSIIRFNDLKIYQISKIKIKYASQLPNTRLIKLTVMPGEKDIFFSVYNQSQIQLSCKLIYARLTCNGVFCNYQHNFNGQIEGIVKRKNFFGNWQEKYCIIFSLGLKLSDRIGSPATHMITSVPEIWTRFDIIQGSLLVIKMMDGVRKMQIAIPIKNAMNWLVAFCTLIRP